MMIKGKEQEAEKVYRASTAGKVLLFVLCILLAIVVMLTGLLSLHFMEGGYYREKSEVLRTQLYYNGAADYSRKVIWDYASGTGKANAAGNDAQYAYWIYAYTYQDTEGQLVSTDHADSDLSDLMEKPTFSYTYSVDISENGIDINHANQKSGT